MLDAFRIVRNEVDAAIVPLGNVATDDPRGREALQSLCACDEERMRILSMQHSALVNILPRRAAVVLQKPIRKGFGLTVAERERACAHGS